MHGPLWLAITYKLITFCHHLAMNHINVMTDIQIKDNNESVFMINVHFSHCNKHSFNLNGFIANDWQLMKIIYTHLYDNTLF